MDVALLMWLHGGLGIIQIIKSNISTLPITLVNETFPQRTHMKFFSSLYSNEWIARIQRTHRCVQCIYLFTSLENKLRKSMNVNKTIGKRAKSFSAFILNACLEYSCVTTCQKLDYGLRIPMNIDISLNSKLTNWLHRFWKVNLIDSFLSVLYRLPKEFHKTHYNFEFV